MSPTTKSSKEAFLLGLSKALIQSPSSMYSVTPGLKHCTANPTARSSASNAHDKSRINSDLTLGQAFSRDSLQSNERLQSKVFILSVNDLAFLHLEISMYIDAFVNNHLMILDKHSYTNVKCSFNPNYTITPILFSFPFSLISLV